MMNVEVSQPSIRNLPRQALAAALLVLMTATSAIALEPDPVQDSSPPPGERSWSMFRGNPRQTGVAYTTLPEQLKVRWRYEAEEAITSTAAIVNGIVYFGCDDGFLHAVDLATGDPRWKYEAGDMIRSSPTFFNGVIFFGDSVGVVHAVDAASGSRRWTFETGGEIVSSVNHADGRLVLGSYDGLIYCLSPEDGKLLWKFETGGRVHGTPGISAQRVLAAGCDEFLHVLRLADGKSITKVSMASVSGASAAIDGSLVYVGTYGGHVLGIDWVRSGLTWVYRDPEMEFPVMSSAAVAAGTVVVGGRDKHVRALDAKTGKQKWAFPTKARVEASPVIVGPNVIVGSNDGKLYTLELATGAALWHFDTGAPISASAAVAGDSLVVGTEDGVLYCFGAE